MYHYTYGVFYVWFKRKSPNIEFTHMGYAYKCSNYRVMNDLNLLNNVLFWLIFLHQPFGTSFLELLAFLPSDRLLLLIFVTVLVCFLNSSWKSNLEKKSFGAVSFMGCIVLFIDSKQFYTAVKSILVLVDICLQLLAGFLQYCQNYSCLCGYIFKATDKTYCSFFR